MKTITFDSFVRGMLTAFAIVAAFLVIKYLSGVLLPFLVAWLLAYMIHPMVAFFQYRLHLRYKTVSIMAAFGVIGGVISLAVLFIVPPMIDEFTKLIDIVTAYAARGARNSIIPGTLENSVREWIVEQHFEKYLEGNVLETAKKTLPQLWNIAIGTVNVVLSVIASGIVILYTIFLLYDFDNISENWLRYIPARYRHFASTLTHDVKTGMNSYFRGQAFVAFIVGIVFAVGFIIIDFPIAIGLGILFGILNMVPYLQYLGFIPAVVLALLKSADTGQNFWGIMGEVLIVFIVVQIIQDIFLIPRIMGKAMGLKPAMILLSLSVWGSLLGILGMIIALPATTLIISYYKRYIINTESVLTEEPVLEEQKS